MKVFVLTIYSLLYTFLAVHSQTKYYFGSNATSPGDGSKHHPFIHLSNLSTIELKGGDTVFFNGGTILKGTIRVLGMHGRPGKPIVFTSYGKSKAKIFSANEKGIEISASSYFVIHNLIVTGLGRKEGNTTDGIKLINCESVNISKADVSGFQKAGVMLYNCRNIELNSVVATNNGAAGILVEGDYQKRLSQNIHIINCRAENNPGDPTNLTNHSGNGILVGNCKNVLIEYCTATNNGWDMPRIGNGPVGIWAYEADSVIIQHCISYRNKTAKGAADGGGFDLDGGVTNSVIQYCLSYENQGSGYGIFQYWSAGKWKNNTLRYCISINDGKITENASGMYIWNGNNGDSTFTDFYAYNNFFYNDAKYAFSFAPESQHLRFHFFNNVFIAADTSDIYLGIDSSYNDFFLGNVWAKRSGGFAQNGFNSLEEWAHSTGYEMQEKKFFGVQLYSKHFDLPATIKITNPRVLSSDPILKKLCQHILLNKGIDVKIFGIDPGKRDFFGNSIPKGIALDIGICEMK